MSVTPSDVSRAVSDYAGQGLEAFVKARTQWLDFAAQQNAQVISALKAGLNLDDNSPAAALADFAQQAVTNYVEVQKRWLDLATQLPFMGAPEEEVSNQAERGYMMRDKPGPVRPPSSPLLDAAALFDDAALA